MNTSKFSSLEKVTRPKESRPFVRDKVSLKFFITFSETLQLDKTWIGDKNVPSGFSKKNGHFWAILTQKWPKKGQNLKISKIQRILF